MDFVLLLLVGVLLGFAWAIHRALFDARHMARTLQLFGEGSSDSRKLTAVFKKMRGSAILYEIASVAVLVILNIFYSFSSVAMAIALPVIFITIFGIAICLVESTTIQRNAWFRQEVVIRRAQTLNYITAIGYAVILVRALF